MERIEIQIARKFHKVYEKLAPEFGYTTRPETREFDENSSNGKLMIAVCKEVVLEELDKAREEGYQNCMDDIWEEGRGLRGWTEHDGSISSADIEAGLQEVYLSIEDKLKDNK